MNSLVGVCLTSVLEELKRGSGEPLEGDY